MIFNKMDGGKWWGIFGGRVRKGWCGSLCDFLFKIRSIVICELLIFCVWYLGYVCK